MLTKTDLRALRRAANEEVRRLERRELNLQAVLNAPDGAHGMTRTSARGKQNAVRRHIVELRRALTHFE